jgi:hypothetical protein
MQVLQSLLEEADQRQTSSWLPRCLVAADGESREAELEQRVSCPIGVSGLCLARPEIKHASGAIWLSIYR